jgi:hypothetical protein
VTGAAGLVRRRALRFPHRLCLLVLSPVSRERQVSMTDVLLSQLQSLGAILVLLGPLALLVKHERRLKRWLLRGGRRRRKRPALSALE